MPNEFYCNARQNYDAEGLSTTGSMDAASAVSSVSAGGTSAGREGVASDSDGVLSATGVVDSGASVFTCFFFAMDAFQAVLLRFG